MRKIYILFIFALLVTPAAAREKYSLEDCISITLENNPSLASSKSSLEASESRIWQSASAFYPNISAGGSLSRSRREGELYDGFQYGTSSSASVSASMPLITFGKNYFSLQSQRASYRSSDYSFQDSVNQTVFNLKKAYFNLVYAKQAVNVLQSSVDQYEKHLKQAESFYKIGIRPKIDVTTAEVNLNNVKLNLITAKNAVRNCYAQLSNVMGIKTFDYDVADDLDFVQYSVDFDAALTRALEKRPDLLAAESKTKSSEYSVSLNKANYLPDLSASASYGKSGDDRLRYENGSVGLRADWSLFNGFSTTSKLKEAKANLKAQQYSEESVRQGVLMDITQTHSNLIEAENKVPVAKLNWSKAKENLDLASGRYRVGVGSSIEMIDAENSYRDAGLQYVKALADYKIAVADILRATGQY